MHHRAYRLKLDARYYGPRYQRGAFIVVFALCLLFLVGLIGMAIDIGQIYNRKTELQNVVDGAALAAAKELNGTSAGIANAVSKAKRTAEYNYYSYFHTQVSWSDAALSFSTAANGAEWLDTASAQATPSGLLYAKVDTAGLDAAHGTVTAAFTQAISPSFASTTMSAQAIAGRPSLAITPLAVCAQPPYTPTSSMTHTGGLPAELVEFGFRRGVGYNLMNPLYAVGSGPQVFVVDPLEHPSDTCVSSHLSPATVAPFMRTGTLLFDQLPAAHTVYVSSGVPASLTAALNTRFNQYDGVNTLATMAQPDSNIRAYTQAVVAAWISTPVEKTHVSSSWGVLWSYAIPRQFSSATPYSTTNWSSLYPKLSSEPVPVPNGVFPAPTPYQKTSGAYFLAPTTNKSVATRRVITIPLLDCIGAPPAAGSCQSATVLGYGQFFLTVPADAAGIYAEFGGAIGLAAAPSSGTVVLIK